MSVKLGVGETAHLNEISQSELGVCLALFFSVPLLGVEQGRAAIPRAFIMLK